MKKFTTKEVSEMVGEPREKLTWLVSPSNEKKNRRFLSLELGNVGTGTSAIWTERDIDKLKTYLLARKLFKLALRSMAIK